MTCIVGLETSHGVMMGADSATCIEGLQVANTSPKLFRRRAHGVEWVIGAAGDTRVVQVLHACLELPKAPRTASRIDDMMATTFATAVMAALEQHKKLKMSDGKSTYNGDLLVGVRGRVYLSASDGAYVRSRDGYMAIGSGSDFALGSMHASACYTPRARIRKALMAAERYGVGVRGPFTVLQGKR